MSIYPVNDSYVFLLPEDCLLQIVSMCDEATIQILRYVPQLVPRHLLGKYKVDMCSYAASVGSVSLLEWAIENEYTLNSSTLISAATGGHICILEWSVTNGCEWHDVVHAYAAGNGQLETLKWIKDNGYLWKRNTCTYAAAGGHLEVLKWARANGCEWDSNTCNYAIEGGYFEVLKWAIENGCEWGYDMLETAAYEGHLEIVQWMIELILKNTSSFKRRELLMIARDSAEEGQHEHVLRWIDNSYQSNYAR